jgi:hypothetical protein
MYTQPWRKNRKYSTCVKGLASASYQKIRILGSVLRTMKLFYISVKSPSFIYLSIIRSICPSVILFIYLSILYTYFYLSIRLSVHLSILSIFISAQLCCQQHILYFFISSLPLLLHPSPFTPLSWCHTMSKPSSGPQNTLRTDLARGQRVHSYSAGHRVHRVMALSAFWYFAQ